MSNTKYTIADGDSLRPIAKKYGFYDWRTIYDNENNAAFQGDYPANQIIPGPSLIIPDKVPKDVSVSVPAGTSAGAPLVARFGVVIRKGIWNLKWDPVDGLLGKLKTATLQGDTDLPENLPLLFVLAPAKGTLDLGLEAQSCIAQGGKVKLTWDLTQVPQPQLGPTPLPIAVNSFAIDQTITCNVATLPLLWTVPLYRFYQPPTGDHFYTISWDEGCSAVAKLGYKYEGIACYVGPVQDYALPGQKPKTIPMYRASIAFVDPNGVAHADHFYTTSKGEMDAATGGQDTVVAMAESLFLPLFRLYGLLGKFHFYTSDQAEFQAVKATKGVTFEGVIGYVKSAQEPGTLPLYRLYGPPSAMTTDQKTFIDTPRYHITFLQHPDPSWVVWGEIKIVDKTNNTDIDVWGDPHVTTDSGDVMEFQKEDLTLDLEDNTKVVIRPTAIWPGRGVALIDSFCVIRPPAACVVTGLSTPNGKTFPVLKCGQVLNNSAQVDAEWSAGSVMQVGNSMDQITAESSGKAEQGGTASNQIDLDNLGGKSTINEQAGPPPMDLIPGNGDHFYTTSQAERDGCLKSGAWVDEGVVGYVSQTKLPKTSPLLRLYSGALGSHFYTTSQGEANGCVSGGWVLEGTIGYVWDSPTFAYEGIAYYVAETQIADTAKLLRAFNSTTGDHFYTSAQDEMTDATGKLGYSAEGTAGYVWSGPPNRVMFYRMWSGKDHFYTMSQIERDITLSNAALGYADELYAGLLEDTRKDGVNVPLFRLRLPLNTDHFYTTDPEERDYAKALGYTYEGLAGYVRQSAGDGAVELYRSYNDQGPMTTDQHSYIDTGRYRITFSQPGGQGQVIVTDKTNNTSIDCWGDPHVTTDTGNVMEFQKNDLTIVLQDKTKIRLQPTALLPGTNVALINAFCVIRPPQAVVVTGMSTLGQMKGGPVQDDAAQVDSQWQDGIVLVAGDRVDQLSVQATGAKLAGGTAANQINLDQDVGGSSGAVAPGGGKFKWIPGTPIGDHFYTTEKAEHDAAIPEGWADEGLSCYIWPGPPYTPKPPEPVVIVIPPPPPPPPPSAVEFSLTCSHRAFPLLDFCHVIPRSVDPKQQKPHEDTLHITASNVPPGQKIHWRVNCNITKYNLEQDGDQISFDTDIWQNDTQFWLPAVAPRQYEVLANGYQGGPKQLMVQVYPANSLQITAQQKLGGANLTASATTFPKPQHTNAENAALKVFTDHRAAIDACFQGFLKTYYDAEHDTPQNAKKVQFKVFPALQLDGQMGWQEHTDHRAFFQHDISLALTVVQASFRMPYKYAFLPSPLKKLAKTGALSFIEIGFNGSLALNATWQRLDPDGNSAHVALVSEVLPVTVYGVPARVNKKVIVHMTHAGSLGLRLVATPLPGEAAGFKYQIQWLGAVTTTIESTQGVEVSGLQWQIIRDNDIKNVFASPQTFQLFT